MMLRRPQGVVQDFKHGELNGRNINAIRDQKAGEPSEFQF
jgi:hypothetical protein